MFSRRKVRVPWYTLSIIAIIAAASYVGWWAYKKGELRKQAAATRTIVKTKVIASPPKEIVKVVEKRVEVCSTPNAPKPEKEVSAPPLKIEARFALSPEEISELNAIQ